MVLNRNEWRFSAEYADDAVKAGAVLLLLVILAGLQRFGLLAGFVEWLKAATVAAIVPK